MTPKQAERIKAKIAEIERALAAQQAEHEAKIYDLFERLERAAQIAEETIDVPDGSGLSQKMWRYFHHTDIAKAIRALKPRSDLVCVPREPELERLISMAVRFDHGFGLLNQQHQESLIRQMRQLYEEASGQGFYAPEHAERYKTMLAAEVNKEGK